LQQHRIFLTQTSISLFFIHLSRFGVIRQTALAAEPAWSPPADWKEQDFEAELTKLEKEADERMEAKVAELMSKIETTGK